MSLSGYFTLWGLSDNTYPFTKVSYLLNRRLNSGYSRGTELSPWRCWYHWNSQINTLWSIQPIRCLKPAAGECYAGLGLHRERALGLGHEVFSRCKFVWNGIILSSEKFFNERKGTKGNEGEERWGVLRTREQGSATAILPINQRCSWVESCWTPKRII